MNNLLFKSLSSPLKHNHHYNIKNVFKLKTTSNNTKNIFNNNNNNNGYLHKSILSTTSTIHNDTFLKSFSKWDKLNVDTKMYYTKSKSNNDTLKQQQQQYQQKQQQQKQEQEQIALEKQHNYIKKSLERIYKYLTFKDLMRIIYNVLKNNKKKVIGFLGLGSSLVFFYYKPETFVGRYIQMLIRFSRAMDCALHVMYYYKVLSQTPESDPTYKGKAAETHQYAADKILELCLKNGGLYIKAGQYIASLNHILPVQYTKTLAILQDKAPWRSYEEVEQVFKTDLGLLPSDIFSDFEKIPIAAASLAQVHRAMTKEGDEVAVKVQYPDLQRNFEGDTFTHGVLLSLINLAFPDFEFNWMADEMKNVLVKELDFTQEADNSIRAKNELKDNVYAYVPIVYQQYSSKRILTTEFIHGCKINDIQKIREWGLKEKDVAQRFMEIFSEQIFIHGFIHVDPHQGNILLSKHPQLPGQPLIVILDHGLYRELDEEFRLDFCNLYKNLVLLNNKKVKKYSQKLGVENWKLFSSMILMRNFEGASVGLGQSIPKEELERLVAGAMERMKELNVLMKTMPRHLLLILRNNNLLRSINMELGAPVNRFSIMARYAAKGLNSKEDKKRNKVIQWVSRVKEKVHLEVLLKGYEIYYSLTAMLVRILLRLGLINPEKEIKKAMEKLG